MKVVIVEWFLQYAQVTVWNIICLNQISVFFQVYYVSKYIFPIQCMEVFIVEWLVWYGQYLVCTKYLIIELNGWYAQNTSSIEWLLWYAQNTQ